MWYSQQQGVNTSTVWFRMFRMIISRYKLQHSEFFRSRSTTVVVGQRIVASSLLPWCCIRGSSMRARCNSLVRNCKVVVNYCGHVNTAPLLTTWNTGIEAQHLQLQFPRSWHAQHSNSNLQCHVQGPLGPGGSAQAVVQAASLTKPLHSPSHSCFMLCICFRPLCLGHHHTAHVRCAF